MRGISLCLCALLMATTLGVAQQPKARLVKLDPENELDQYLIQWEQRMDKVKSFAAVCNRTMTDSITETKDHFTGTIHFLKPSYVLLNMENKENPKIFERFISSGNFLYRYVPDLKQIEVYQLPGGQPGQAKDDSSLAFLFGMKAVDAKKRYDLKLAKTDQHYIYVDIFPVFPIDQAEFKRARLVLDKASMLPRQLWFQHPTKAQVLWDFPKIQQNPDLNKKVFDRPKLPEGWKFVPKKLATAPPSKPRVIREQQP